MGHSQRLAFAQSPLALPEAAAVLLQPGWELSELAAREVWHLAWRVVGLGVDCTARRAAVDDVAGRQQEVDELNAQLASATASADEQLRELQARLESEGRWEHFEARRRQLKAYYELQGHPMPGSQGFHQAVREFAVVKPLGLDPCVPEPEVPMEIHRAAEDEQSWRQIRDR